MKSKPGSLTLGRKSGAGQMEGNTGAGQGNILTDVEREVTAGPNRMGMNHRTSQPSTSNFSNFG